jgi:hypothetical protein
MQDDPQANTAIDAIRCVYLARMSEQRGNPQAAQRWQRLADGWMILNTRQIPIRSIRGHAKQAERPHQMPAHPD